MTVLTSSYAQGALWSVLACLISAGNDALLKVLNLPLINTLFFRFLFTVLTLLPLAIRNPSRFATKNHWMHALRGVLFACAMLPWCYGLRSLELSLMTLFSFSTPLFVVLLAGLFLGERVGVHRIAATVLGFAGICISITLSGLPQPWAIAMALAATATFATLDILNKRLLISNEGIEPLMLYSAVWTTLTLAPFCFAQWQTPTIEQLLGLAVLGLGGNALFWCILRAASISDLSALQPLRYTEFFFAATISYFVFDKAPGKELWYGLALLVPATLYLSQHELRLERKRTV